MTTVRIDWENNSEVWWDAARAASDCPAELHALIYGLCATEVEVESARLPALLAWCASFPGWSDGPQYARHPLMVREEI